MTGPRSLVRSSRVAIAFGAVGAVTIAILALILITDMRGQHERAHDLIALQLDLDAFSVSADGIVATPYVADVDAAFRAEAEDLQVRLDALAGPRPDLARASATLGRMLDLLDRVRASATEAAPGAVHAMATYGSVLDSAIGRAIDANEATHAARSLAVMATFALASLGFALLAIGGFRLLHRRVALPVRDLTHVAERIAAGDDAARAGTAGRDELARLGAALDAMLDRQRELNRLTARQRAQLETHARQLAEAQRIAQVGSWERSLEEDAEPIWSAETYRILDMDPDAGPLTVAPFLDRVREEERERLRETRERGIASGDGYDVEVRIRTRDGGERPVRLKTIVRTDADGRPIGLIGTVHDLTRQKEEERLRSALLNALPAQVALVDADGSIVHVNDRWRAFAEENGGEPARSGPGTNYLTICEGAVGEHADEAPNVADGLRAVLSGARERFLLEYPCHAPDRFRWFRAMVEPMPVPADGGLRTGAVVMHVDVTDRKLAEERLHRLAFHDRLTDLASRHGFTRQLVDRLEDGWSEHGAVVLADVENLRGINDTHGFASGDALLVAVGRRLREAIGPDGLAARTGGDQFAVWAIDPHGDLPQRLVAVFDRPFRIGARQIEASARFGRARTGEHRRSVETLLREAEVALYHARTEVKAGWVDYDVEMDRAARERIRTTEELRTALREGQFRLHFQPQVDLSSGAIEAGEALIRWRHPTRGLLSPGAFIEIAERSGLIGAIGDWVIYEACRALRSWSDAGHGPARIAVNVSIEQFASGTFPATVREALDRHGVDPRALTLEITESVFERESPELWRDVRSLHAMGVRLSLDDFGTGFSSLMYLKKYPFDEIKIDRAFVRDLAHDRYSRKLVGTILAVGEAIGASVLAEGIETDTQRDALLELGCRFGQGFRFSVPLAEEDFRWLLRQNRPLPLHEASVATDPGGENA